MRRASTCSRNLPPNPYHISVAAQGFQPLERDVDVRSGVPITLDLCAGAGGRDGHRRRGRPRGGSARARSDGAHRHRPEPDRRSCRSRSSGGLNQVDHARLARRRRRLERLLPSDRRSRADAVLDRQPAGHRPAEPRLLESDLAGRRAVDGSHHRRGSGRIRRQEQPHRAHRHQVGARPAEADRQRVLRLRVVQEPVVRGQRRRAALTRSGISCRSAACGPIGSSIRRSSRRCTTRGTASRSSTGWTRSRRPRHVSPERPGGPVVVRRAEHARPAGRRPGSAPGDHDVQRCARLFTRDRFERAVHGERLRAPATN